MARFYSVEELERRRLLSTTLAVVGDFSSDDGSGPVSGVSSLVKSWSPAGVVTVGDNNYPDGAAATIDSNIGQWYHDFISPYKGTFGAGSADGQNHFWPALGNHDWNTGTAKPYTDYFTLPNNERYYTKQIGNVGIFVVDSDSHEPDGTTATSTQGKWIQAQMAASTARWKLVFMHHPPYSSGSNASNASVRWPYKDWGATAVFAGHDHDYERLSENGLTYFVNGLGGETIASFQSPIAGSQVRFNGDFGAMRVDAGDNDITFKFVTRAGKLIDTYTISDSAGGGSVDNTIVSPNSVWKYLDNGTNQGTAWRASSFDDSTWKSGAAQLGYGDGGEATTVGYGSSATNRFVTTYFRKSFSIADADAISAATLNLVRDDGAVVYLNGVEIYRNNMPAGTISSSTLAASTIGDIDESAWNPASVNPALLVTGTNVLAVEIHQSSVDSSDISFDFQLSVQSDAATPVKPAAPTTLTASPVSTSQINLVWNNNATNQTGFKIERSIDGVVYAQIATVAGAASGYSDTGRAAATNYFYRVRATNAAGDSDYSNLVNATTFAPAATQAFLSDLTWASATNGYKTVQKDKSNRGNAITIRRTVYDKGLGVHAASQIAYNLAGKYASFVSDVGIDDEVGDTNTGAVIFRVIADGKTLFDSGVLTTQSPVVHINVDVTGVQTLTLIATNGVADSIDFDHADWAGAYLLTPGATAAAAATRSLSTVKQAGPTSATAAQTAPVAATTPIAPKKRSSKVIDGIL